MYRAFTADSAGNHRRLEAKIEIENNCEIFHTQVLVKIQGFRNGLSCCKGIIDFFNSYFLFLSGVQKFLLWIEH